MDEVIVLTRLANIIIVFEERVDTISRNFIMSLKRLDSLDGARSVIRRPETVILIHIKFVFESKYIEVGRGSVFLKLVSSSRETVRPSGPEMPAVSHEETVVGDVRIVDSIREGDSGRFLGLTVHIEKDEHCVVEITLLVGGLSKISHLSLD